jgi:hypothetical protein
MISLPADVRFCIYDILFPQPFRVVIGDKALLENINRTPQESQVLEVCREIHDEAVAFVYRKIGVKITNGYSMLDLHEMAIRRLTCYIRQLFIHKPCGTPTNLRSLQDFTSLEYCTIFMSVCEYSKLDDESRFVHNALLWDANCWPTYKSTSSIKLNFSFHVTHARRHILDTPEARVSIFSAFFFA